MSSRTRRIGIIAALPGELKPLVRGWDRLPVARGSGIEMWQRSAAAGGDEVIAVCAGMGASAARRAFTAAEFRGALDAALSVGWAGALTPACAAGVAFEVSSVADLQTGERFEVSASGVRLVTAPHVAAAEEKVRLAQSYGASLVDMEAAVIARLAQMRGIPFRCFKAVSDGQDAQLPDLNPFIDVDGKLKMGKFLGHVALRPQYWGPLAELGRNSATAAKTLAKIVEAFLHTEGN